MSEQTDRPGGALAGIRVLDFSWSTEAVRRLAGRATNQVPDARVALLHAEGGIASANCTARLTT